MLKDVCPMRQAQGFLTLDLTGFPGNPEDGWPSIDSRALRCHSLLPPSYVQSKQGRGDPGLPRKEHLVGRAPSARGLLSSVAP